EEGHQQVLSTVSATNCFDRDTIVVSSDFKRAAETAIIIQQELRCGPVEFDDRLRERFFGGWEGQSHENYSKAWMQDCYDPDQVGNGAESSASVLQRMLSLVESLEERYSAMKIILVSHGDPLMILQTAFAGMNSGKHRSLPYFETAELRPLN
ncbi:MAG TPA: histidine phosphatase family protein, partial [Pontiella sp.]